MPRHGPGPLPVAAPGDDQGVAPLRLEQQGRRSERDADPPVDPAKPAVQVDQAEVEPSRSFDDDPG